MGAEGSLGIRLQWFVSRVGGVGLGGAMELAMGDEMWAKHWGGNASRPVM